MKRVEQSKTSYAAVTVLIALCKFIFSADFSATNVALSTIGHGFNLSPAVLSWVIAANSLFYAGFLIFGGKVSDVFGRRRFCIIGLCCFGAGTILAALAPDFAVLIFARGLEGLGSAFMVPASFSLINVLLPEGPIRHRAFSFFSTMQGVATLLGLVLGGVFTSHFGWRSIFLLNLPVLVTALFLTAKFIPRQQEAAAERGLDAGGALLITLAVALVLFFLLEVGWYGLQSAATLSTLACALIASVAFFYLEGRLKYPLLPLSMLSRPNVLGANLASMASMATSSALFALLNLFMQRVMHFTPMMSGFGMMPFGFAVVVGGQFIGPLMARAPMRLSILLGFAVLITATICFVFCTRMPRYSDALAPAMVLAGLGSTVATYTLMALGTSVIPTEQQGVGTGLLITCQQIGLALGAPIVLTVFNNAIVRQFGLPEAFARGFVATATIAVLAFLSVAILTRRPKESSVRAI